MKHFQNKQLELYEMNVTLSKDQKQKIRNAFINYEKIRLRLSKDALRGKDTLLVPTNFFQERDGDDPRSLDACISKKTLDEMRNEMLEEIKCFEDFDDIEDKYLDEDELEDLNKDSSYKKYKKIESFRNQNLSDEMLENEINKEIWEYYDLFFEPGIDKSIEEGIEFNLNYSLLNYLEEDLVKNLAKDFVKDNIKKLFQ